MLQATFTFIPEHVFIYLFVRLVIGHIRYKG